MSNLAVADVSAAPIPGAVSQDRLGGPEGGASILLTDQDCAALLGCSRSHWRAMHQLGHVPGPIKLGRLARWRRAELLDWVNQGCPPRHWKGVRS